MDNIISLAVAAGQLNAARGAVWAGWASAIANFAVVVVTCVIAMAAQRSAAKARKDAEQLRIRIAADNLGFAAFGLEVHWRMAVLAEDQTHIEMVAMRIEAERSARIADGVLASEVAHVGIQGAARMLATDAKTLLQAAAIFSSNPKVGRAEFHDRINCLGVHEEIVKSITALNKARADLGLGPVVVTG